MNVKNVVLGQVFYDDFRSGKNPFNKNVSILRSRVNDLTYVVIDIKTNYEIWKWVSFLTTFDIIAVIASA